jgi:hypothetical protein
MSASKSSGFSQLAQNFNVMVGERGSREGFQTGPIVALRHLDTAFIAHLQEEQICQLFDVIAVVDSIVAQRVAKAPEFIDDVGHKIFRYGYAARARLSSSINFGN